MKRITPASCFPLIILSLFLSLSGCSTSSSVVTGEPREPISPDAVKIYRLEPDAFEEIAIVEANSKNSMEFSEQGKTDVAIQRLKEKAAELGANGILMTGVEDGYGGSFSLGVGGGSYSGSSGGSVGASTSTANTYKIASGIALYVPEKQPGNAAEPE
jgi:hypothetical protein